MNNDMDHFDNGLNYLMLLNWIEYENYNNILLWFD
jgi:hypothetical protein